MLGLCTVGGYKHHPVDDVGDEPAHCEHRDGTNLHAAVASGEYNEYPNQQAGGDPDERVSVLVFHGYAPNQETTAEPSD